MWGQCVHQLFPERLGRTGSPTTGFSVTSLSMTFGGPRGGVRGDGHRLRFFGGHKGWDCELPGAGEQPQWGQCLWRDWRWPPCPRVSRDDSGLLSLLLLCSKSSLSSTEAVCAHTQGCEDSGNRTLPGEQVAMMWSGELAAPPAGSRLLCF